MFRVSEKRKIKSVRSDEAFPSPLFSHGGKESIRFPIVVRRVLFLTLLLEMILRAARSLTYTRRAAYAITIHQCAAGPGRVYFYAAVSGNELQYNHNEIINNYTLGNQSGNVELRIYLNRFLNM